VNIETKFYLEGTIDIEDCTTNVYTNLVDFLKSVIHNEGNRNISCTVSEDSYNLLCKHPLGGRVLEQSYNLTTNSFLIAGVTCKICDEEESTLFEIYLDGKKTKHFCNLKEK
jgi:hypothetical protein